jgi:hypothetical protein
MKALLPLISAAVLALAATPALAEDWHPFSRSAATIYFADVDSIVLEGEVTSVRVGIVSRTGAPGDYTHIVDQVAYRCAAGQVRTVLSTDYESDGAEGENYESADAAWEDVVPNSYLEFLKEIACDGGRSTATTWPSIKAFVDAGRP